MRRWRGKAYKLFLNLYRSHEEFLEIQNVVSNLTDTPQVQIKSPTKHARQFDDPLLQIHNSIRLPHAAGFGDLFGEAHAVQASLFNLDHFLGNLGGARAVPDALTAVHRVEEGDAAAAKDGVAAFDGGEEKGEHDAEFEGQGGGPAGRANPVAGGRVDLRQLLDKVENAVEQRHMLVVADFFAGAVRVVGEDDRCMIQLEEDDVVLETGVGLIGLLLAEEKGVEDELPSSDFVFRYCDFAKDAREFEIIGAFGSFSDGVQFCQKIVPFNELEQMVVGLADRGKLVRDRFGVMDLTFRHGIRIRRTRIGKGHGLEIESGEDVKDVSRDRLT